jgi:hypothetical protein
MKIEPRWTRSTHTLATVLLPSSLILALVSEIRQDRADHVALDKRINESSTPTWQINGWILRS